MSLSSHIIVFILGIVFGIGFIYYIFKKFKLIVVFESDVNKKAQIKANNYATNLEKNIENMFNK